MFALRAFRKRWKDAGIKELRAAADVFEGQALNGPGKSRSVSIKGIGPPALPPFKRVPSKAPTVSPPPSKRASGCPPSQPKKKCCL